MSEARTDSSTVEKASPVANDEARAVGEYFTPKAQRPRRLPSWLNHFNKRDLKTLFKCSIAVWIMTILTFINPTLRAIGQASFFGCIVLFIVPPAGVAVVQLLARITVLIGVGLAWGWGTVTMKAALATRPQSEVDARYQQLLQSAPQNTTNVDQASGQNAYVQVAVFDGYMLDTRVSATYLCMMGLFVYMVSRLRVSAPKLALVQIFAMIVGDVYLTTAPLFPSFNGTISKSLVIPSAIGVGIGLVCNLLIFPQSSSSIAIDSLRDMLAPMKPFTHALLWHFRNPSSRMEIDILNRVQGEITIAYKSLTAAQAFLPMDLTRSRWNPEDIGSLGEPLRHVLVSFSELLQLQTRREEHHIKDAELMKIAESLYKDASEGAPSRVAHHQLSQTINIRNKAAHAGSRDLVDSTLLALSEASKSILDTSRASLETLDEALAASTQRKQPANLVEKHKAIRATQKEVQQQFLESSKKLILDPHLHLFDADGHLILSEHGDHHTPPPLAGLVTGILFQERLLNFSSAIGDLLERIIEIETRRTKIHFWLPKGFRRIFSWGLDANPAPSSVATSLGTNATTTGFSSDNLTKGADTSGSDTQAAPGSSAECRLKAMRKPSGRRRHKGSLAFLRVVNWFGNNEGLYALRVLAVTIGLCIPAVVPASAGFFYREKGLWAVIMAQLAILPYTSEFVAGAVSRILATIAGGVIGLACWYIGAGNGDGNPYGMAAVMAVVIVVLMWWRLFSPPEHLQSGLLMAATIYLVVSYSWIDTHIPSYGNPGEGYNIFWRRILLVLVGFGAAAVVTFFPRPPSGGRHCRHLLSDSLDGMRDRFALLLSTWKEPPSDLVKVVTTESISTEELLSTLGDDIQLLKYEFSTSNFDVATLVEVRHLCIGLNQGLAQMLLYMPKLPMGLRERFFKHSGATEEVIVGEVMAVLTLIQRSLRSGEPLPAILPTPLLQRSLGFVDHMVADERAAMRVGRDLTEDPGRKYVSLIHAWIHSLRMIDHLVLVLKKAVGETSDVDLERL